MKPIKFELTPQELDIVMSALVEQPMKIVNNVVQKIMSQANDPKIQGGEVPPDSKSGESAAESGAAESTEQKPAAPAPSKRKR